MIFLYIFYPHVLNIVHIPRVNIEIDLFIIDISSKNSLDRERVQFRIHDQASRSQIKSFPDHRY